jgi:hypothetical protein
VRLAKLVIALWVVRWLALELAARSARPAALDPDGRLPGSFG